MIKVIQIQNFQRHEKLRLVLDPNITTIVGPSDSGKSSIIRALGWVTFNNPSGMAFIRDGSKGCSVTIKTEHHTIKRSRGKSANYYEVDDRRMEAIRRGEVPDSVLLALPLDSLNFQFQHDSPLWLPDSPGQVAKNLNEIVNLDLIDKVLENLGRRVRNADSEVSVTENRLARAKSVLADLSWVEEAETDYKKLERIESKLDKVRTSHTQLLSCVRPLRQVTEQVSRCEEVIGPVESFVKKLAVKNNELRKIDDRKSRLKDLLQSLRREENRTRELADITNKAAPDLDRLSEINVLLTQTKKKMDALNLLMLDIKSNSEYSKKCEAEVSSIKKKLSQIKTCPVCGGTLSS